MDYFSLLPAERIFDIALRLPIRSISKFCQTSNLFNEIVCDNEYFWHQKFVQDYKFDPDYNGSWKKLYSEYGNLWVSGHRYSGSISNITLIPDIKAVSVASGYEHTLVIDMNANVWAFGSNSHGQLGFEHNDTLTPKIIPNIKGKYVDASSNSSAIIDTNGILHIFGSIGNHIFLNAKKVSLGDRHLAIIDREDTLFTMGYNYHGQLGTGWDTGNSTIDRNSPVQIGLAKDVAVGGYHTVYIDMNDNVIAFGDNSDGQLGLGYISGLMTNQENTNVKAKSIAAGNAHTLVIDLDDNILSAGSNRSGELGLDQDRFNRDVQKRVNRFTPIPDFKAKSINAKGTCSAFIDLNNRAYIFGTYYKNIYKKSTYTPLPINGYSVRQISNGCGNLAIIATKFIYRYR